jgi:hypothetical protein
MRRPVIPSGRLARWTGGRWGVFDNVFRNTPTAVRVYAGQARQTRNGGLIDALDALYVKTLEAYAHARFYPSRPKVEALEGRRYVFDNGWVFDMDRREDLEAMPSHRNLQREFAREAARMIFDHCGLKDHELLDYAPYQNRILQFYGVGDSFGRYLAYVSFWGRTVALLDATCEHLVDCAYATGAPAQADRPSDVPAGGGANDPERPKRNRKDKGKPHGA